MFAARLHPRKRVGLFLEAAQRLNEAFDNKYDFQVFGPDEGDGGLVTKAVNASIVTYGGALTQDELRERLTQAHILVLPSVNEPFSVTVLDAQARGCPVVLSDTNGFMEYVTKSGSGSIFVSDSVASLVTEIDAIVEDRENYLRRRRAARSLIETTFLWDSVARQLLMHYESVNS
jgi:glycosyltransferase involved in cell wall biosynthesis